LGFALCHVLVLSLWPAYGADDRAKAPAGPPEVKIGSIVWVGNKIPLATGSGTVVAIRGRWVKLKTTVGNYWVNCDRLDSYRILE
jgi:hypothetical protein